MAENKTGRGRGRPSISPVAMTAAERMRKSRALKREAAAAQPGRRGNLGYTSQYSYCKRQALKNFAKFVEGSVADKSVTEIAARFDLSDSEWRHLRSGERLRILPERYNEGMLKPAEKAGWLTPRQFRVGCMTFLSYRPRSLCYPQEHLEEQSKEIKEMIESGMDWSDLDYMSTSSSADSCHNFATVATLH